MTPHMLYGLQAEWQGRWTPYRGRATWAQWRDVAAGLQNRKVRLLGERDGLPYAVWTGPANEMPETEPESAG